MKLEICAYSIESCRNAAEAGADRIELCASPDEGGTTPSMGMIANASKVLKDNSLQKKLDLYVMIRPRGGDFVYSNDEFSVMKEEIHAIGKSGNKVDGVVFGILKEDGNIDIERNAELVNIAKRYNFGVTFHRAADRCTAPQEQIIEDIIKTGAHRILTSGQKPTAPEGIENIKRMVKASAGRIKIMCGSGVTEDNAAELATTGIDEIHSTAKKFRTSTVKEAMNEINRIMYADQQTIINILKAVNLL